MVKRPSTWSHAGGRSAGGWSSTGWLGVTMTQRKPLNGICCWYATFLFLESLTSFAAAVGFNMLTYPSEKSEKWWSEFVSWDDEIPINIWENNIAMFQSPPTSLTTTNQSENQSSCFQIKKNHGSGKTGMQHDGALFFGPMVDLSDFS